MTRLLQSGWIIALLGAALYGGVTLLLLKPAHFARSVPLLPGGLSGNVPRPSWDYVNPEMNRLLVELKTEKDALAAREKALDELATRLAAERAEINVVTQAVYRMQQEFDRHVVRIKDEEQANLKRLAKTYAAMSPEGAAKILNEMEDDQVVQILVYMKEKDAAGLLESLAQLGEVAVKRTALISERLRTVLFRETPSLP